MRCAILTVVTLFLVAPVVNAQPAAKETGIVSWQYYAADTAVGSPVQPTGMKANIRCAVIASDGDGSWVCLYVDAIPKCKLPEDKNANVCRPLEKDGKQFKLTNSALLPDTDVTQVVAFVSSNTETTYKLVVKKDGSVSFTVVGPTFAGDTSMSGATSVCWFVAKK